MGPSVANALGRSYLAKTGLRTPLSEVGIHGPQAPPAWHLTASVRNVPGSVEPLPASSSTNKLTRIHSAAPCYRAGPVRPAFLYRYPFNPIADSKSAMGSAAFVQENHLRVSAIRPIDTTTCPICEFHIANRCPRCNSPLNASGYIFELLLPSPRTCRDSQGRLSVRQELGRFIQKARVKRGMSQLALASATAAGISRTGLSRVENGRVLPSVIALIGIAGALLGGDKVTLRVRSETKTPPPSDRP